MTTQTQPAPARAGAQLSSATRLGHVHLVVANLERQIAFYTTVLNFVLHWREGGEAALGTADEVLLRLSENPAGRRVNNSTGLYHFAVLYPSSVELARAMARLYQLRWPHSPTDHGVSMTTYLEDTEGNTIELYIRTLDRAEWWSENGQMGVRYSDGRIGTGRDPLDVEALLAELDPDTVLDRPLPEGTRLGHVHLYGNSLERMMDFYANVLGFQAGPVFSSFRMGDVGLDAVQNHVVAFNTWKGNVGAAPPDALGIRYYTVVLPNAAELAAVLGRVRAAGLPTETIAEGTLLRDPSHIALVLTDRLEPTERG